MIKVCQLAHASFFTKLLELTIEFYTTHLGAHVIHEFRNQKGERYGIFLAFGKRTFLEFFNAENAAPGGNQFRHLCFEVEDIEKASLHFNSIGLTNKVQRGKTDKVLQFFVKDPNGIELEFHQYDEQCEMFLKY